MRNILLLFIFTFEFSASAQLSGVVNSYHAVTSIDISNATVNIDDATGLSVGDTVFFIQMQGADIDVSNNSNYGTVLDYAGTGLYEYNVICSINGTQIIFERKFYNSYNPAGKFQLIGFNLYNDVTVTGTVTCPDWDGNKGGIVLIYASGTLTLNAGIDVNGKGFRGGSHDNSQYNCNFLDEFDGYEYQLSTGWGAMKGEGIAMYTANNAGRGPLANGGGGGNDHNAGGGGGSNMSQAGKGGDNDDPNQFNCHGYYPGLGGIALDNTTKPLFLGGGGGAGHSNSINNSSGGDGGGIVILIASAIEGNGVSINANGMNGNNGFGDGGGGGGAGGTVFFNTSNVNSAVNVFANAGNGGNANGFASPRCFGPGGGGAGGHIVSTGAMPGNVSFTVNGGNNGVVINSTSPCVGSALNATSGGSGVNSSGYSISMSTRCNDACTSNPQPLLNDTYEFCTTQSVDLDAGFYAGATYAWSNGAGTQVITVSAATQYIVEIFSGRCYTGDTTQVNEIAFPEPLTEDKYTLCEASLTIDGNNPNATFIWSDGTTNNEFVATQPGAYSVTISYGGNCAITDEFKIVRCLKIPNTITPNNDGFNDAFEIWGLDEYPGNKVNIYTRNGARVFSATNYDGTWNASGLPDGVYMYAIDLNDDSNILTGTLSVVRQK